VAELGQIASSTATNQAELGQSKKLNCKQTQAELGNVLQLQQTQAELGQIVKLNCNKLRQSQA